MPRSRLSLRPLWLAAPVVAIGIFLLAASRDGATRPETRGDRAARVGLGDAVGSAAPHSSNGRLVIVIVDSLRHATLEGGMLPHLHSFERAPGTVTLDVTTCGANFSLPCLQTLFEGRDSPMAAGMESFAGHAGSAANLVSAAARAGFGVALVSDHTLTSLYGRFARRSFSTDSLPPDFLARDLEAIRTAETALGDQASRVIVLHIPGTDHVTHEQRPGTRGYARHFGAVDARLSAFLSRIDLARDGLVVMGDHGHDDSGHHARHSLAMFAGEPFRQLFSVLDVPRAAVEQKDLLYLLSFPLRLPLPAGYEGRFFAHAAAGAAEPARSNVDAYDRLQRAALAAAGLRSDEIERRTRPDWRPDTTSRWRALGSAAPLLACLLLWVAWTWGKPLQWAPAATLVSGLLALATWWLAQHGVPWWALLPAPLVGALLVAWRHGTRRPLVMLSVLLAAGALTSRFAAPWAAFFHSRDEFHWAIPLFFLVVLGAGLLVAAIRGGGVAAWPSATQLACLLALPAGAYYYQFDENVLRGYLIPASMLALWRWGRLRRAGTADPRPPKAGGWSWRAGTAGTPTLLVLFAGALLVPQEAGGWEWHAWIVRPLAAWPPAGVLLLYVALACALLAVLRSPGARGAVGTLLAAVPLFAAFADGPPLARLVAAEVPILFGAAWLSAGAARDQGTPGREETEGLMLLALSVAVILAMFDGFAVNHVDFAFGLRWTAGIRTEFAAMLAIAPLVALKYGLPLLALFAALRVLLGGEASSRAIAWLLLFLVAKLLVVLLQMLAGATVAGDKFYELAQTDFLFLACLAIVIAMWTVVLWLGDLLVAGSLAGGVVRRLVGRGFSLAVRRGGRQRK